MVALQSKPLRPIGWKVLPAVGGRTVLAAAAVLFLLGGVCFLVLLLAPVSILSMVPLLLGVVGVGAALVAAALARGCYTLRYRLDRGALVVSWLGQREVIPYDDVIGIYAGSRLNKARGPKLLNVRGYRIGSGWNTGAERVQYFTTSERGEDVSVVQTHERLFALTPADGQAFRREIIARVEASEGESAPLPDSRPWPPRRLFGNRVAQVSIGLSVVVLLVMLALTLDRFAELPSWIALHFNSAGEPDVFGAKAQLFLVPGVGAAALVANSLLGAWLDGMEPLPARLVWAACPVVEALALVSLARLLA